MPTTPAVSRGDVFQSESCPFGPILYLGGKACKVELAPDCKSSARGAVAAGPGRSGSATSWQPGPQRHAGLGAAGRTMAASGLLSPMAKSWCRPAITGYTPAASWARRGARPGHGLRHAARPANARKHRCRQSQHPGLRRSAGDQSHRGQSRGEFPWIAPAEDSGNAKADSVTTLRINAMWPVPAERFTPPSRRAIDSARGHPSLPSRSFRPAARPSPTATWSMAEVAPARTHGEYPKT